MTENFNNATTLGKVKLLLVEGAMGASGNYAELINKPSINGVQLDGSKTPTQLGLATESEVEAIDNATNARIDNLIESGYSFKTIDTLLTFHQSSLNQHYVASGSIPVVVSGVTIYDYVIIDAREGYIDEETGVFAGTDDGVQITTPDATAQTDMRYFVDTGDELYDGHYLRVTIAIGNIIDTSAEITDARVGATALGGISYNTLGQAIRDQATLLADDVSDLKADLSANTDTIMNMLLEEEGIDWRMGGISSSDGTASTSSTRLRVHGSYLIDGALLVGCDTGYKFIVVAYDSEGVYQGMWNGTELKKQATWLTGSLALTVVGDYQFKLVLAKTGDTTITVEDSSNIHVYYSINSSAMRSKNTLSNSDDLNDIVNTGFYQCLSGSMPSNAPCSSGGILAVYFINNVIEQVYYNAEEQHFRLRSSSGTWNDWMEVSTNNPVVAIYATDFVASPSHARTITVSWSSLYIKYWDRSTVTISEAASYELSDAWPTLLLKNGEYYHGGYANIFKENLVLLQYNNGEIVGGLLYPQFNNYRRNNAFENDSALNVYKKSTQLDDVKWTPLADVRSGEGLNPAGTEVTGVPYSSVKEYLKFVGVDVSLHTFMTTVHDIHSLLYTEKTGEGSSTSAYGRTYHGVNCSAYFGTVCSGLTSTAIGSKVRYDSWQPRSLDCFEVLDNQDARNLKVGDILSEDGHVSIVTQTVRHEDGSLKTIKVHEHIAPVREYDYGVYGCNDRTAFQKGVWCRYKRLDENTNYSASPFVLLDGEFLYNVGDLVYVDDANGRTYYRCKRANRESTFDTYYWTEQPVYTVGTSYNSATVRFVQYGEDLYRCIESHTATSTFDPTKWERIRGVFEWSAYPFVYNDDIVTFAGDRACFRSNDLIYINFDENTSYTQMELYKDGTLIQTLALSGYQIDVSSYCSSYGMYKARLTDGSNYSAYTYFEVVDTQVSASYSDDVVTVNLSSANGTPFDVQIVEQSGFPVCHAELTADEIASGQVVISPQARLYMERSFDMDRYADYNKTIYARVLFEGEYGNVTNEMISLGSLNVITGELVYPNKTADFGTISTATNIILAERAKGNSYKFSFTAGANVSVSVLPTIGTVSWINALPQTLTNGTTYLVSVDNGIGNVESL